MSEKTKLTTSELLVLSGCARQSGAGWQDLADGALHGGQAARYRSNADFMYGIRDKIEAIVAERDNAGVRQKRKEQA